MFVHSTTRHFRNVSNSDDGDPSVMVVTSIALCCVGIFTFASWS